MNGSSYRIKVTKISTDRQETLAPYTPPRTMMRVEAHRLVGEIKLTMAGVGSHPDHS